MDTRCLEAFLLAVDNGSLAEAGRRLDLTAAAVAKRIHSLESEVGAVLVARSGRTVRPTEAGAAIIEPARKFLIEARNFGSIATTDRPSGQLRLGAFQSALTGLLPDVLALTREKYPQIDVHITRGTGGILYRKVLDGELDAAIIGEPPFAIPKAYDWRLLREEPLIVLTRPPAPSRNPHAILASQPFIRLERNSWTGRLVDGYLRKAGIQPIERFELDGVEAITVMVARGLGVSLLPDWAPPWPEGLALAKLPVPDHSFARRIGLVWARSSLRLRLVRAFLEQAAEARRRAAAPRAISAKSHQRR